MHRIRTGITLSIIALTSACAGTSENANLGTVPHALVDLYDRMAPAGMIEVELDRNGAVLEMEADIRIADLPEEVVLAAEERFPRGRIVGAERELKLGGTVFEVKILDLGRNWELLMDGNGRIIETEQEITMAEAPPAVLSAAEGAIPASRHVSVEVIRSEDETVYHVKRMKDLAIYKVVLAPNGDVLRLVREARAEIEIPIED